jgi:hypothetical protein
MCNNLLEEDSISFHMIPFHIEQDGHYQDKS